MENDSRDHMFKNHGEVIVPRRTFGDPPRVLRPFHACAHRIYDTEFRKCIGLPSIIEFRCKSANSVINTHLR
jgi:hypothetical protein